VEIFGSEILSNTLYLIAQSLLIPVIITIFIFITYAVLSLGGFLTENFSRSKFGIDKSEQLIRAISKSNSAKELDGIINESELDSYDKEILCKIIFNHDIGPRARKALATKLMEEKELQSSYITQKTDILVRLGPTLGLMGTLIPLGPGLAALGNGNINELAQALTIAFDATVTGLAAGSIGFIISRYRQKWYMDDLSILEAITESLLEALDKCQKEGDS
jgi:biopolymer transport protein ExbB/TolQ